MKQSTVSFVILALGIIGLGLWSLYSQRFEDIPPLVQSRHSAINSALQAVKNHGWKLGDNPAITADVLRAVPDSNSTMMDYLWKYRGKYMFHGLVGEYVFPTGWDVRLSDGIKTINVYLDQNGTAFRLQVELPDTMRINDLPDTMSMIIARGEAATALHIHPDQLKLKRFTRITTAERKDRIYTFHDLTKSFDKEAQYLVEVSLAGDRLIDIKRYIQLPRPWKDKLKHEHQIVFLAQTCCNIALGLLLLLGSWLGIKAWRKGEMHRPTLIYTFLLIILSSIIIRLLSIPADLNALDFGRPLLKQWLMPAGIFVFWTLLFALATGITSGFIKDWKMRKLTGDSRHLVWGALGLGGLALGLQTGFYILMPQKMSLLPDVSSAAALYPGIVHGLKLGVIYLAISTVVKVIFYGFDYITDGGTRNFIPGFVWFSIFGFLAAIMDRMQGISRSDIIWLVLYAATAAIFMIIGYMTVFRHDFRMLTLTTYIVMLGWVVDIAVIHPFPDFLKAAVLAVLIMSITVVLSLYYDRIMVKQPVEQVSEPAEDKV